MTEHGKWGPWIWHDGGPCPCVGRYVHVVFDKHHPLEIIGFATGNPLGWIHDVGPEDRMLGRVIRYRIWRPKPLRDLIALVEDPPPLLTELVPA